MGQLPDMMRAVVAEGSGGPEVLKVVRASRSPARRRAKSWSA